MPNTTEKGEALLESYMFEVLVTISDHMGKIEDQLMRSWFGQPFYSRVVEEVESAAITWYGGLGNSQLMTEFAERADANEDVPDGTIWVTACGNASQVIDALAEFVEIFVRFQDSRQRQNETGNCYCFVVRKEWALVAVLR